MYHTLYIRSTILTKHTLIQEMRVSNYRKDNMISVDSSKDSTEGCTGRAVASSSPQHIFNSICGWSNTIDECPIHDKIYVNVALIQIQSIKTVLCLLDFQTFLLQALESGLGRDLAYAGLDALSPNTESA